MLEVTVERGQGLRRTHNLWGGRRIIEVCVNEKTLEGISAPMLEMLYMIGIHPIARSKMRTWAGCGGERWGEGVGGLNPKSIYSLQMHAIFPTQFGPTQMMETLTSFKSYYNTTFIYHPC